MTAMRRFGEDLGDLAERLPAVADLFHSIQVTFRLGEVIEEGDLHALFDEGLAGERGFDFLLAATPHHYTARAAHALGHAADTLDESLPRMPHGLQNRAIARRLNLAPFDTHANHGLVLSLHAASTPRYFY
ncbi:hypothetical protein QF001_001057 [Paraburkholderia youngii]